MLPLTPQQTKFAADAHLVEGQFLHGKQTERMKGSKILCTIAETSTGQRGKGNIYIKGNINTNTP
jgi:hypothetical protein